ACLPRSLPAAPARLSAPSAGRPSGICAPKVGGRKTIVGGTCLHLPTVSLTVTPVRDVAGRLIGPSKVARDITDRRQTDALRARLAAIVDSSDGSLSMLLQAYERQHPEFSTATDVLATSAAERPRDPDCT